MCMNLARRGFLHIKQKARGKRIYLNLKRKKKSTTTTPQFLLTTITTIHPLTHTKKKQQPFAILLICILSMCIFCVMYTYTYVYNNNICMFLNSSPHSKYNTISGTPFYIIIIIITTYTKLFISLIHSLSIRIYIGLEVCSTVNVCVCMYVIRMYVHILTLLHG